MNQTADFFARQYVVLVLMQDRKTGLINPVHKTIQRLVTSEIAAILSPTHPFFIQMSRDLLKHPHRQTADFIVIFNTVGFDTADDVFKRYRVSETNQVIDVTGMAPTAMGQEKANPMELDTTMGVGWLQEVKSLAHKVDVLETQAKAATELRAEHVKRIAGLEDQMFRFSSGETRNSTRAMREGLEKHRAAVDLNITLGNITQRISALEAAFCGVVNFNDLAVSPEVENVMKSMSRNLDQSRVAAQPNKGAVTYPIYGFVFHLEEGSSIEFPALKPMYTVVGYAQEPDPVLFTRDVAVLGEHYPMYMKGDPISLQTLEDRYVAIEVLDTRTYWQGQQHTVAIHHVVASNEYNPDLMAIPPVSTVLEAALQKHQAFLSKQLVEQFNQLKPAVYNSLEKGPEAPQERQVVYPIYGISFNVMHLALQGTQKLKVTYGVLGYSQNPDMMLFGRDVVIRGEHFPMYLKGDSMNLQNVQEGMIGFQNEPRTIQWFGADHEVAVIRVFATLIHNYGIMPAPYDEEGMDRVLDIHRNNLAMMIEQDNASRPSFVASINQEFSAFKDWPPLSQRMLTPVYAIDFECISFGEINPSYRLLGYLENTNQPWFHENIFFNDRLYRIHLKGHELPEVHVMGNHVEYKDGLITLPPIENYPSINVPIRRVFSNQFITQAIPAAPFTEMEFSKARHEHHVALVTQVNSINNQMALAEQELREEAAAKEAALAAKMVYPIYGTRVTYAIPESERVYDDPNVECHTDVPYTGVVTCVPIGYVEDPADFTAFLAARPQLVTFKGKQYPAFTIGTVFPLKALEEGRARCEAALSCMGIGVWGEMAWLRLVETDTRVQKTSLPNIDFNNEAWNTYTDLWMEATALTVRLYEAEVAKKQQLATQSKLPEVTQPSTNKEKLFIERSNAPSRAPLEKAGESSVLPHAVSIVYALRQKDPNKSITSLKDLEYYPFAFTTSLFGRSPGVAALNKLVRSNVLCNAKTGHRLALLQYGAPQPIVQLATGLVRPYPFRLNTLTECVSCPDMEELDVQFVRSVLMTRDIGAEIPGINSCDVTKLFNLDEVDAFAHLASIYTAAAERIVPNIRAFFRTLSGDATNVAEEPTQPVKGPRLRTPRDQRKAKSPAEQAKAAAKATTQAATKAVTKPPMEAEYEAAVRRGEVPAPKAKK